MELQLPPPDAVPSGTDSSTGGTNGSEYARGRGEPTITRAAAIAAAQDFEPDEPGMRYRKITTRAEPTGPLRIFVELDAGGYECRRVEHSAAGPVGTAEPTSTDTAELPDYARLYPGAVMERITSTDFQVEWILAQGRPTAEEPA
ncbi:hypothetical protein [Nocardia bovistercoris]|uniref:Uncharacterized protein n=1 Tax=Nocardia bovistercoris TaxID=2785916 RepID=A0A931N2P2_9NOCA|nr:hypothetical protein [Nocardia bovistercoris]MBH0776932.1 hypothetical protein [Nocardia bovistercoris]